MKHKRKIKVLIIDDSAYNRRALSDFLLQEPDMSVVGKACDGEEGLQLTMTEEPDVITLDLEMPRMDGFTFLRILMAKKPTPVIVISSHAEKENVFRALELGALDFVSKPTKRISPAINEIRHEVAKKVRMASTLKKEPIVTSFLPSVFPEDILEEPTEVVRPSIPPMPDRVIAIAASTGGPTALSHVLGAIPGNIDAGIVIVQHMPPRFTRTFATRLDKQCQIEVKEVTGYERLRRGVAYLAPGYACLEVSFDDQGLTVGTVKPIGTERYVPSADRLFSSVAAAVGNNTLAVVLTGMGDDGSRGVVDISKAGGIIIVEDESTAVIPGMPKSAVETGTVNYVLPLDEIAPMIMSFVRRISRIPSKIPKPH